jgi:hypothetical protein
MLLTLVQQARRRLICNHLLSQGTVALCAGLAAFILLLLLGTQVLDWRWAALLPLGAAGLGLYRTWQRAPGEYRAAQIVDDAMGLKDALSTAYFFENPGQQNKVVPAVREWQHAQAESLCPSVDLTVATPYRMPRAAYSALSLFLVAGSLFGLRYGLSHRLDLRAPLVSMLSPTYGQEPVKPAAAQRKKGPKNPEFSTDNAFTVSSPDQKAGELDPAAKEALDQSEIPDFDNALAAPVKGNAKSKGDEGDKLATDDPEGGEEAAAQSGENGEGQNGKGQPKDGEKSASNQAQPNSGENSSLMQKMKEAMQNLLSKMKQPPPQSNQPSQSAQAKGQKQPGQGKQQGQQQKQQSGGEQSESQEGEPGEDAKADANAQSKGQGQSQDQQANKQPGSGIGKQDGAKDLKLAEQMAAMGKITEIIGKRSANVSGEVMIEVQNTNQQLSTRYEAKQAAHGDTGGEINRDEVPVALQGFVQNYFEQVRAEGAKAEAQKAKAQK